MGFLVPAFLSPLFSFAGIVAISLSLVDSRCHEILFLNMEMESICLKSFIAKCLGWGMTAASAIVKVPQIKNMLEANSSAGLAPVSVYLETFMYCCSVSYFLQQDLIHDNQIDNFNDYGENVFLVLQNIIIIVLMWKYMNTGILHITVAICCFFLFWYISFNLPQDAGPVSECIVLTKTSFQQQNYETLFNVHSNPCLSVRAPQQVLLNLSLPLMLMSRIPQIIENFQNGHTGILSMVTLSMNGFGSLARIFTTFQVVTGVDYNALVVYALSFGLNFALFLQCIVYQEGTRKALAKKGD